MRTSAFPGTISAQKEMSEEDPARASPGPAMERGANTCPGEAQKDVRARTRAHRVKVVALMCDLHELLVGEPKRVLEGGVFSCTKDDLEGTRMKQSRRLDGLQTKSSLGLDFPLEMLFIYRRES